MSSSDAKTAEQQVYSIFQEKKTATISELESELQNSQASAYTDLSNEMKAYMDYICDTLLTKDTGILMSDQIDKNDATYIAWAKDETINLYTYLNYAISKNWIDTSKLGSSSYSSSEEIYQEILKYLKEYLEKRMIQRTIKLLLIILQNIMTMVAFFMTVYLIILLQEHAMDWYMKTNIMKRYMQMFQV